MLTWTINGQKEFPFYSLNRSTSCSATAFKAQQSRLVWYKQLDGNKKFKFCLTSLTLGSVGAADPTIYKNNPILNRLVKHLINLMLTLFTIAQMWIYVLFGNRIAQV